MPDPRDAEDILPDVFTRLLEERERFRQRLRERLGFGPPASENG